MLITMIACNLCYIIKVLFTFSILVNFVLARELKKSQPNAYQN